MGHGSWVMGRGSWVVGRGRKVSRFLFFVPARKLETTLYPLPGSAQHPIRDLGEAGSESLILDDDMPIVEVIAVEVIQHGQLCPRC